MNKYQEKLDEVLRIDAEQHSVDFTLLIIKSLIEDLRNDLPEGEFGVIVNDLIKTLENSYFKNQEKYALQD
jgi:hypothetical protein